MKLFIGVFCFFTTSLLGCYNSSATFCRNLSEEYSKLLEQDENIELRSWENLYIHHEFLAKPLLENWERSYFEKEQFFSLTFYAFLRSQSTLECGIEPKENTTSSEKRMQAESIGLTKIETESHPYFECLFSEWKKHAKPLIFKSCKYYFTH
ncbi:MAG: hypothetical protein OXK80_03110 [Bdellovibrionales bacterium]|nr:hypothetical protein [Bdellovibrionales bacterium]